MIYKDNNYAVGFLYVYNCVYMHIKKPNCILSLSPDSQGECQLLGDLMVLLRGVGASEFAGCSPSVCEGHGLRHKAMLEVRKLRQQLTNTVNAVSPSNGVYLDPKLTPPTQEQVQCIQSKEQNTKNV